MDILKQKIRIGGVKNGVILGIAVTALTIFSFYFITALTTSPMLFIAGPIIFRVFVPIVVVVLLCFRLRKSIGGLWTFKQATTGIFIMFFAAYIINVIGIDLVFNKFIEPDNIQKTQAAAVNMKTSMMREKGADQKKIDAAMADMKKDFLQKDDATVWGTIMGNAIVVLFLFVFALIFSSLLRNAEYVPASQAT